MHTSRIEKLKTKARLVYGVGVNDADYQVGLSKTVGGKRRMVWQCPFYRAWVNMLARCYSGSYQEGRSSYVGCAVCPEWLTFSVFRSWMERQEWEGKQLDKDILISGNKVYSPKTCIFVTKQMNSFLLDCGAGRGKHFIGSSWRKDVGKFDAQCSNPFTGKNEHIGLFDTNEAAHEAWRQRKHEFACIYADQQADPRIAEALRLRFSTETTRKRNNAI